jgi:hypothetical protein
MVLVILLYTMIILRSSAYPKYVRELHVAQPQTKAELTTALF